MRGYRKRSRTEGDRAPGKSDRRSAPVMANPSFAGSLRNEIRGAETLPPRFLGSHPSTVSRKQPYLTEDVAGFGLSAGNRPTRSRSEERRVGKEGTAGLLTYDESFNFGAERHTGSWTGNARI